MRAAFYFIYNQLEKQRPGLVEIHSFNKKNQSVTELVLILLLNYFEIFKSQNQ
jgi:hypothetical protein